jgi:hypothetical protein
MAGGRFSRKRKGVGFIERIKPPDEAQTTKFQRKRKKRKQDPNKALTETEWDDDGADDTSPDSKKKSPSKVLPLVAVATLVIVAVLIAVVSNNGVGDTKQGAQNSPAMPGLEADAAPVFLTIR